MNRAVRFVMLAMLIASVSSCINGPVPAHTPIIHSAADFPSNPQRLLKDQLRGVRVGMSLADFERTLPDAYPIGAQGSVTAWEIVAEYEYIDIRDTRRRPHDYRMGLWHPDPRVKELPLWFYFHDDALIQWGEPNDWPTPPDIIIERRDR